jgi:aspartate aminotransferase
MPAAHGAFLVAEILNDDQLCQSWEKELASMRARVNQVRSGFASAMAERGYGERFGFVADQFGMFSFLGITADQVMQLREKHSVYMLESSRISVAGLTRNNLDYVADSLADVLKETD